MQKGWCPILPFRRMRSMVKIEYVSFDLNVYS